MRPESFSTLPVIPSAQLMVVTPFATSTRDTGAVTGGAAAGADTFADTRAESEALTAVSARFADLAATDFPVDWRPSGSTVLMPVVTTASSRRFMGSVSVTVSPGATSYRVIFRPNALGVPTTLRGGCALAASRALAPLIRIDWLNAWAVRVSIPAPAEESGAFSATTPAARPTIASFSRAGMFAGEAGARASPDGVTPGASAAKFGAVSLNASVAAPFARLFSFESALRCTPPTAPPEDLAWTRTVGDVDSAGVLTASSTTGAVATALLAFRTVSAVGAICASLPPFLSTTRVPAATTSTVAAARKTHGSMRFFGAAAGITPRGALSSAVRIRDAPAINPRASATAAAHSGHSFTCASTRAASSALSAPSSHE